MLSSIGRAAVRRVVTGPPRSTNKAFQSIWHLRRVFVSENVDNAAAHPSSISSFHRSYATTTKAPAKKPAAAKVATKAKAKKPAKKPAKKAVKAKPKKPVKKAAKKPKKKELTEDQQKKLEIRVLKKKALSPPKSLPSNAWLVFVVAETASKLQAESGGLKAAGAKFKTVTPAELESYNHTANQNHAANELNYKRWVTSHTPDEIRLANNARKLLKKRLGKSFPLIQDDRIPKRPSSALMQFTKSRNATGDYKGLDFTARSDLVAREFKDLSPSERKVYEDLAAADRLRYAAEVKTVFHREVSPRSPAA